MRINPFQYLTKLLVQSTRKFVPYGLLIILAVIAETIVKGVYRDVLILGAINAIICVGAITTNSIAGLFSLGFGGIALVASYAAALFTLPPSYKLVFLDLPHSLATVHWSFVPALLVGVSIAVLAGLIFVIPSLRLRGHYFILITLGLNIIFSNLAINLRSWTHGPLGIRNIPFFTNGWWAFGALLVVICFSQRFSQTRFGRALKTIGRDEVLAASLGINVPLYKLLAFIISSVIIGLGGILWVHYIGSMHPNVFDLNFVFLIVAMYALGGSESIWGAILGAFLITSFMHLARPIQEGFTLFGYKIPPLMGLMQVLISLILIITMIFRPSGLIKKRA
ncbi:MAG: branched-chain amino acid ABC transporter permease [Candidatus Bathyarchaeia archaeon]